MDQEPHKFFDSLKIPLFFVVLLWIIKATEMMFGVDFAGLGVTPKTLHGMVGIFTAPLIHGDLTHLMSNSVPLLILGTLILYFYSESGPKVIIYIYLLTGAAVWLLAREVTHIGASGLVYGFAFYLFFSGVFRKDVRSLGISFFVIFAYGSIVWGLLPNQQGISWESHLFGAISGIIMAYVFKDTNLSIKLLDEEEETGSDYRYIYLQKDEQQKTENPLRDGSQHGGFYGDDTFTNFS